VIHVKYLGFLAVLPPGLPPYSLSEKPKIFPA